MEILLGLTLSHSTRIFFVDGLFGYAESFGNLHPVPSLVDCCLHRGKLQSVCEAPK